MFDKLDFILEKYEELSMKVSDPDVICLLYTSDAADE